MKKLTLVAALATALFANLAFAEEAESPLVSISIELKKADTVYRKLTTKTIVGVSAKARNTKTFVIGNEARAILQDDGKQITNNKILIRDEGLEATLLPTKLLNDGSIQMVVDLHANWPARNGLFTGIDINQQSMTFKPGIPKDISVHLPDGEIYLTLTANVDGTTVNISSLDQSNF